jgi:hypothetical protein
MNARIEWHSVGRTRQYGNLIIENVPDDVEIEKYWHGRGAYPWAELIRCEDGTWAVRVCIKRYITKESK